MKNLILAFILIAISTSVIVWLNSISVTSDAISAFLGVLVGAIITAATQYWLAESDRKHQLRMAALDKRLAAHQQAYSLWRKLLFADKQSKEIDDVILECQDWWEKNCLYLSPNAREAFRRAYMSAGQHATFLKTHAEIKLVKEAANDVRRAGKIIVEGAGLPPFGDEAKGNSKE